MSENTVIKHLKFPVQFDGQKLAHDLSLVLGSEWVPHFNTGGYTGNWNALSLYAKNGDAQHIFVPMADDASITETPLMKNCAYFREVIQTFQFPILSVRLLKLEAGAEIKPHRDHELGYEDNQFRLHIPVVTNPGVEFILDGEELKMLPGECWYANVNFVHSVANRGKEDRVHLVIDGVRNAWSDEWFFAQAPKSRFETEKKEVRSAASILRTIEELKGNPQTAAHPLIALLEEELNGLPKRSSGLDE
ncbi:aspartyl/asparaginyl beta-hydroxylase domain-containing protein [Fluviicola sp.]|uniref:aspartyl/asparaginyl beta-hydroxylase domain-containing protein n=1 Tax=Fluviicola sp. TaxID=1917219 RepID=UPI0031DAAC58